MSTGPHNVIAGDPGLSVLVMLLRFHGVGADPEQIRHRFGAGTIGIPEMLRCAKEFGLKARSRLTTWERLVNTPLPGDRGAARRRLPAARQGRRRQGAGAVAVVAPAHHDDAGRIRGGVGWSPGADDAPCGAGRSLAPVRHHLVPRRHSQIPAAARRGARRLVLPAGCSRWSRRCSSRSSSTRCWCIARSARSMC